MSDTIAAAGHGPYKVHPALAPFPDLDPDDLDVLAASIKRNGLREPIVLNHDGTVLIDGRQRLRACDRALVDPVFIRLPARYTDDMITNFVRDANAVRRHLPTGMAIRLNANQSLDRLSLVDQRRLSPADRRRERDAERFTKSVSQAIGTLWNQLAPDAAAALDRSWRSEKNTWRDLPGQAEHFTGDGLRELAAMLSKLAAHLDEKGVTL
jgi:hypothetical protein